MADISQKDQTNPAPLSENNENSESTSMFRLDPKNIIIILLIIISGILGVLLILPKRSQLNNTSGSNANATPTTTQSNNSFVLPVRVISPVVKGYYLTYFFSGIVKTMTADHTITLADTPSDIPSFPVTNTTAIIKNQRTTTISQLKPGSTVDVQAIYYPEQKKWFVVAVTIH